MVDYHCFNYGFGCFWIDLNSLAIVLFVTSGDVMRLLLNPDSVHVMYAKHQGSVIYNHCL